MTHKGNFKAPTLYRCRASYSIIRGKDGEGSFTLGAGEILGAERYAELVKEGILSPEHVEAIEVDEFQPPDESETE